MSIGPSNWAELGKSAGYTRNAEMAEYAEALIAIHKGGSKGTQHMINLARGKGLRIFVLAL